MTATVLNAVGRPKNLKSLLFVSNQKLTEGQSEDLLAKGFSVFYAKVVDDLSAEISSLRPFALVLDVKYCTANGFSLRVLLQKLNPMVGKVPVFLINASNINYLELLGNDLVYAVLKQDQSIENLGAALIRYQDLYKKHRDHALMRFGVSLPCLVKKLGSSGLLQGVIKDISPKGMRLELELKPDDWTAGDELRFSFTSSKKEGASYLDGFGHLRWSMHEEEKPGIKKVRVGVQFSQLPEPTLQGVLDIVNSARLS